MKIRAPILILTTLFAALAGCSKIEPGTRPEEESARQIANRAEDISAAADAAVNQQIADIQASEDPADAQADQNGGAASTP